MIIYDKNETNFNTNGYGFLTDIISAYVEEELNGDYSLTLEYVTNGKKSEYLVEDNIIKCKVADGSEQLFIITNISKNYDTLEITAKHIFYQLYFNMLEDVYPKNLNAHAFLQWILSHTQYETNFTGSSNINAHASARYVRKNPVEAILGADNCMINLFGGELKRDNFNIELKDSIGKDNGVKCQFAKNITGIDVSIDTTETFTRIMPIGFDGLLLPEKYVDSPFINNYPYPKIGIFKFEDIKYDPEDEEAYHDIDEAYIALRNEVRKLYEDEVDKASVSISVDWLELSKVKEYEQYSHLEEVNLGDTIHVDILGMDFKTKVVKTKYNPLTDRIESFEIGTIRPDINSSINSARERIEEINPTSILEQAKSSATSLITQAMGGYIYKTNNELYIMDTDNPETAQKVWCWNINGLGYSSTGINGPYGLAMTMDGSIVADYITTGTLRTNVIEGYDSLVIQVIDNTRQYAILSQTLSELNSKIGDIVDISTSAESDYAFVELTNVNQSEPITIKVRPTMESISYLYPHNNIYPSSDLYLKTRKIRFHNYTTNEDFDYVLPDDLLIYDEDTYDEFFLDYDTHNCRITKRCAYNADGTVRKLAEEVIVNYDYPTIYLTDGNYSVELLGYEHGYLFTRLMAANIYTTQFATKAELHSSISQTAEEINMEVRRKVNEDEVVSTINQSAEQVMITGNRFVVDSTNFKLTSDGHMTCSDGTFNGQINSASGQIGGFSLGIDKLMTKIYAPYDFTETDRTKIRNYLMGTGSLTNDEKKKYDLNGDGKITSGDYLWVTRYLYDGITTTNPGIMTINSKNLFRIIDLVDGNNNTVFQLGLMGIHTSNLSADNIQKGMVHITPRANAVTSVNVTFDTEFSQEPYVTVTPNTSVPFTSVKGVSVSNITTTGCTINIYRTDTTQTTVYWMAML